MQNITVASKRKNAPACDSWETASDFVFCLDMPGLEVEAIQVEVDGGAIKVAADRPPCESGARQEKHECRHGHFERALQLPAGATPDAVTATYHEGVLQIVVPKRSVKRRIEVKQAEHSLPTAPTAWLDDGDDAEDFDVDLE